MKPQVLGSSPSGRTKFTFCTCSSVESERKNTNLEVGSLSLSRCTSFFQKINVMRIKVNDSANVINVGEDFLEVKNKRLYNNVTKRFEGLDGDVGSFTCKHDDGNTYVHRGTIDGYTCSGTVKFRGSDTIYRDVSDLRIEHISVIVDQEMDAKEYSLIFS